MDNGQSTSVNPNPFFTDGISNLPGANHSESQNSPNSEAQSDNFQPLERDVRGIGSMTGNAAMGQPNQLNPEIPAQPLENQVEGAETVNLEMPPGAENSIEMPAPAEVSDAPTDDKMTFNADNIVVAKEKLPKSGIGEVDKVIGAFDKDHDIARFYNTAHEMRETYLKKMRGKELGKE